MGYKYGVGFTDYRDAVTICDHRQLLASSADLARKVEALEKKYDSNFKVVFDAIKKLMMPPVLPKSKFGFIGSKKKK